jgi:hypothetical protein
MRDVSMKFRKKPVVIDAIQYNMDNQAKCLKFLEGNYLFEDNCLKIKTLEGNMMVSTDDYIIKGVNGEFYPCKPDIFKKTYELAE